jgi:hypothetical protein
MIFVLYVINKGTRVYIIILFLEQLWPASQMSLGSTVVPTLLITGLKHVGISRVNC